MIYNEDGLHATFTIPLTVDDRIVFQVESEQAALQH